MSKLISMLVYCLICICHSIIVVFMFLGPLGTGGKSQFFGIDSKFEFWNVINKWFENVDLNNGMENHDKSQNNPEMMKPEMMKWINGSLVYHW